MKKELNDLLTPCDHAKRLTVNGAFEIQAYSLDECGERADVSGREPVRVRLQLVYTLAHDKALFRSVRLEGKSCEELTSEIPTAMESILDSIKNDLLSAFRNGHLLGEVR